MARFLTAALSMIDTTLLKAWDGFTDRKGRIEAESRRAVGLCACGERVERGENECDACFCNRQN